MLAGLRSEFASAFFDQDVHWSDAQEQQLLSQAWETSYNAEKLFCAGLNDQSI